MQVDIKVAVVALALLGGSAPARAALPPPENAPIQLPLDTDVSPGAEGAALLTAPANNDLQHEYPRVPLFMQLSGRASMTCKALTDGRLDDCHVISEDPVGMGFGAATVRAATYFRVKPAMKDGKPVESMITIPMRWQTGSGTDQAGPPVLAPAEPTALALGRRLVELEDLAGIIQARWRPMMRNQAAMLTGDGDAQAGQRVMDSFRLGLDDATREEVERQAHELAAHDSEADLRATVAFLESPAGRTFIAAQRQAEADPPKDFSRRVDVLARGHLCPQIGCAAPSPSAQ